MLLVAAGSFRSHRSHHQLDAAEWFVISAVIIACGALQRSCTCFVATQRPPLADAMLGFDEASYLVLASLPQILLAYLHTCFPHEHPDGEAGRRTDSWPIRRSDRRLGKTGLGRDAGAPLDPGHL